MKKFSLVLKKSINLSNIDVLTKIFEYDGLACRLFWLLILCTLTGPTIWLFILNFKNYFEYEVVTKIEILNERQSDFPVVTICDNNPFSTVYAQNLIEIFQIEHGFNPSNLDYSETFTKRRNLFQKFRIPAKSVLNDDNKRKLGFDLDLITSCNFEGNSCDIKNDFNWYYSYEHGNCWQFNSGKNDRKPIKKISLPGKQYGLEIIILPLINFNKLIGPISDGLVLFVHNQSHAPSLSERMFLRPGKESHISVRRIFTFNQPQPYSKCQDLSSFNSELFSFFSNEKNSSSSKYRQMDCLDLCRQRVISLNCGCYFPKYDMLYSMPPCLNTSQAACLGKYTNEREILTDDTLNECLNECPLECDSIKYRMKLSTLKFPNEQNYLLVLNKSSDQVNWYRNATGKQGSYEDFQQMSYSIKVFYSSIQYSQITQSPKMELFDLFSQIGGSLGVFMGMSVFHLIEIVEIICGFIANYVIKDK